jgi:putative flippase GtrA
VRSFAAHSRPTAGIAGRRHPGVRLALAYCLFALIATVANIASQELSLLFYRGAGDFPAAVAVGTIVGLVVKYVLDKKYIFAFRTIDAGEDARLFVIYTCMGVITTLIFWGFEFAFDRAFQTKVARYFGAVVGLAIGYWLKYQLDKRFVFRRADD